MTEPDPQFAGPVPGAFNLRDLGGNAVEGGVIAAGRVYRCDLLHRVDARLGHDWLVTNDVRTLIDLRTGGEREGDGFMEASEHLDSRHRGLLDEVWSWEAEKDAPDEWFLRDRTIEMFERFPRRIATVLADIADAPAGVLFHCTAGKDRTGVIASALLGVLGASKEVIVADYARSAAAMPGIVGWYRNLEAQRGGGGLAHDPELERRIVERAAAPATMEGVVDTIVERHGSFTGWMIENDIDLSIADRLRRKLVVAGGAGDVG